jgi:hypothetical protein
MSFYKAYYHIEHGVYSGVGKSNGESRECSTLSALDNLAAVVSALSQAKRFGQEFITDTEGKTIVKLVGLTDSEGKDVNAFAELQRNPSLFESYKQFFTDGKVYVKRLALGTLLAS